MMLKLNTHLIFDISIVIQNESIIFLDILKIGNLIKSLKLAPFLLVCKITLQRAQRRVIVFRGLRAGMSVVFSSQLQLN